MLIALDAGNSRIKWAVHDGAAWCAQGRVATHAPDAAQQLAAALSAWPAATPVVGCNVAGPALAAALENALTQAGLSAPDWLRPAASACSVRNGYREPERLGADRWAALLGARALGMGDCLVVCAGTATTVDRLSAAGDFLGGLILPGFDLMRRALAGNTAQLPLVAGDFTLEPKSTADAIASGCLFAQLGAIERMFVPLAEEPGACCLLTGGGAELLSAHLQLPWRRVDSLILDGLRSYAAERLRIKP